MNGNEFSLSYQKVINDYIDFSIKDKFFNKNSKEHQINQAKIKMFATLDIRRYIKEYSFFPIPIWTIIFSYDKVFKLYFDADKCIPETQQICSILEFTDMLNQKMIENKSFQEYLNYCASLSMLIFFVTHGSFATIESLEFLKYNKREMIEYIKLKNIIKLNTDDEFFNYIVDHFITNRTNYEKCKTGKLYIGD